MRGSTGRQRVPFSVFRRELNIALPPREEQQKIATVLYTVDRAIQILSGFDEQTHNAESEVERLCRLKRALLQDLLSGEVRTADNKIQVPEEITQYG
jgi:type I restriction enzyme S subunit